jgi:hypothetical protein
MEGEAHTYTKYTYMYIVMQWVHKVCEYDWAFLYFFFFLNFNFCFRTEDFQMQTISDIGETRNKNVIFSHFFLDNTQKHR